MRKLLPLLLSLCFVAFAACSDSDSDNKPKSTIKVSDNKQLDQGAMANSTETANNIEFTTSGAWTSVIAEANPVSKETAAAKPNWLSITPESGSKAGDYTIEITLNENYTGKDRAATITVICGDAKITITVTQDAKDENGEVPTPTIPVESITIDKTELELPIGSSDSLSVSILPIEASAKEVTWSSSDTTVVSVNSLGKVTAKAEGEAIVTATSVTDDSKTATCIVTVTDPTIHVEDLVISKKTIELPIGSSDSLWVDVFPLDATVQDVVWSSSDTTVVSVNSLGKLTPKAEGEAIVTATSVDDNSKTATCIVTVTNPIISVQSLTINKKSLELPMGSSDSLWVDVLPHNAVQDVVWSSSDTTIVSVSPWGKVTAKSAGQANVTATSVGDKSKTATCNIMVIDITNPSDSTFRKVLQPIRHQQ